MLTNVIPILLLIGSLTAGVTCFTWSGGPEANSTVRPCPGDNVTLDWMFSLSDKDRPPSVQWFLAQDNKNQKTLATASPSGSFFKFPDIKTRVEFLPPAGLRLYNVSTRDLGTYTVSVTLFRPGGLDFRQRSVTLALPEKPYLSEGRLVASLEPRTVTVNGTSHARLACGTILNHQDASFSVVWKTPGGQTVPSSGQSDGIFYLFLANPVEGGAYHCHLHGVTSLTCQHNGTQSSAGRVEVDGPQTRLMVLEASAGRHDRQLLHADTEAVELTAALEREANDSLEVRAAVDDLRARTQSLEAVHTELSNVTAEHTQQLNTQDKRLDTVNKELRDLAAEHTQHLNTLGESLNTLDTKLDTVNTELSNLAVEHAQQLNTLDESLNTLDKRLDTVDTELNNVTAVHTEQLGGLYTELESVVTRQEQGLDRVDAKLTAAEREIQQATATLGALTADGREQSQQLQHLAARVDQLADTVGQQEGVIANLTDLLKKLSEANKVPSAANCLEVKQYDDQDGVHTLSVKGQPLTAFCDQTTAGGGWTVIQRRQDGSVNFYRDWSQYEDGFGDVHGEYWLGLRNIHRMTSSARYTLRVDLEDFSGNTAYVQYSHFSVSGPETNYRLSVSGYSGTAGDTGTGGLSYYNNMQFSTRDRDNDRSGNHCAAVEHLHGAWWYNACGYTNLNGPYRTPGSQSRGSWDRLLWYGWRRHESLKRAEMKIKPS